MYNRNKIYLESSLLKKEYTEEYSNQSTENFIIDVVENLKYEVGEYLESKNIISTDEFLESENINNGSDGLRYIIRNYNIPENLVYSILGVLKFLNSKFYTENY